MKKAFFEDSAMAMAKLIVESIYHGMEEMKVSMPI